MSQTRTAVELGPLSNPPATGASLRYHGQAEDEHDAIILQSAQPEAAVPNKPLSKAHTSLLITTVATISFFNTLSSGLLTVSLPAIARSVNLAPNLLLWPASVYALVLSCTLLLVGSIADIVGPRPIFITGTALLCLSTLAVSLSRMGIELIAFRAIQGLAMSLCMPTSVSIITSNFPSGQRRNVAFALFGGASPIGFALGLVLGGAFTESVGWRLGFYLSSGINALIFLVAIFTIPTNSSMQRQATSRELWQKMGRSIDWIGVGIASVCLALLSYVFANITLTTATLKHPTNLTLLIIAVLLVPAFPLWMHWQTKHSKPAVIPNALWRRMEFTSICIAVFLTWSQFNAYGYWSTLFFQESANISSLGTSLRFLPLVVAGFLTNVVCGLLVAKVSAGWLVFVSSLLSAISPALMATCDPMRPYFPVAFIAMVLSPISCDILFNVSNLVITASFEGESQALAGGVFNTVSQLGNSVGLAITSIVASTVTASHGSNHSTQEEAAARLVGYRAAFWWCFGAAILSCLVASVGLRKSGKVGLKRD